MKSDHRDTLQTGSLRDRITPRYGRQRSCEKTDMELRNVPCAEKSVAKVLNKRDNCVATNIFMQTQRQYSPNTGYRKKPFPA